MSFKSYLTERAPRMKSERMLSWMSMTRIPISPKFFEDVFGTKEIYCFQAIEPDRIPSVIQRQHKRNQVSTFTTWKNSRIFWGPTGSDWKGMYPGDLTVIAVLKGKHTLVANSDIWSHYEEGGRRWIDVNSMASIMSDFTKLMTKVLGEIRSEFLTALKKAELTYFPWTSYNDTKYNYDIHPTFPRWEDLKRGVQYGAKEFLEDHPEVNEKLYNKDKNRYIKLYFDSSYKVLKEYKDEILKAGQGIARNDTYNEVLCYDYEVIEFIVHKDNTYYKSEFLEDYENEVASAKRHKIPIKFIEKTNDVMAELNKYKKKNKEIK